MYMIKVTDYFYTPADIWRGLRIRHAVGIVAALFVAAGLKKVGVGTDVLLFVSSIVATQIWLLDARVPFVGAIACFIAIMIASLINPTAVSNNGSLRERLAVIAFYFLVVGVLLLLREHIRPAGQNKPYIPEPADTEPLPAELTDLEEYDDMPSNITHTAQHSVPHNNIAQHTSSVHHSSATPVLATANNHAVKQAHHPAHQPTALPHSVSQQTVMPQTQQAVAARLKHATQTTQQPPVPPTPTHKPLPHMQRSPYLLDLRSGFLPPKKPLGHHRRVNDVAVPEGFKPKPPHTRGPIQL